MLTTFHATLSRSTRLLWLLEELEADYRLTPVSISRPDGSGGPDPNNPHPLRQVPCIVHDGEVIVESLAIWLHLTDVHAEAGLSPAPGRPGRTAYMGWMGASTAVFEPLVTAVMRGEVLDERLSSARLWFDERLERALGGGPWLLGESFSTADLVYASLLAFFPATLSRTPAIEDWLGRCRARPALARARAKDAATA